MSGDGELTGVGADASAKRAAQEEADKAQAKVEARKKLLDKQEISDDYFASNNADGTESTNGHTVRLKHPRGNKESQPGYVSKKIVIENIKPGTPDEKWLVNGQSDLYNELVEKNVITFDEKTGEPKIDVFFEFGGEDEYKKFIQNQLEKNQSGDEGLFHYTPEGIVPKNGIDAETIALAHDVWLAEKKLTELTDKKQSAETENKLADDGNLLAGAEETVSTQQVADAQTKLVEAQTVFAKRVEEVREKQRKEDLKNKKITEIDARAMLMILKALQKREGELRKQITSAPEDQVQKLQEDLKKVVELKVTEMMRAIGYSEEDINVMRGGVDSNLPLVLQLARHTSNSKDLKSPEVRDLCNFVKLELISSVHELINKTEKDGEKSSWDTVRTMKWPAALRGAMTALGITGDAQGAKITELWRSTKDRGLQINPEGSLNEKTGENDEDTLTVLLEALVTGEPAPDVGRSVKGFIEDLKKEFDKTQQNADKFNAWLKEKLEALHPEIGEAAAAAVAGFINEHMDLGAFMDMLLLGDTYSSLARDLGYKSKEHLKAEGKNPVDADEVDSFIRKNGTQAENARRLLCAGIKDIVHEDVRRGYLNDSAKGVLLDKSFKSALDVAFSKDHHKLFSVQLLECMDEGDENTQEKNKTTLTHEAMVYIMSLPEMAEKLKWEDGGGGVEEKKEGDERKKERAVTSKTDQVPAQDAATKTAKPSTQAAEEKTTQ